MSNTLPTKTPENKSRSTTSRNSNVTSSSLRSEILDSEATLADRNRLAAQIVSRFTAWTAVAGIIPVPVADVVAVAGLQLQMLRRLAELYGVPFTQDLGKSAIAAAVGSVLPASVAAPVASGISSLLKGFPVIGTTIASVTQPALSGSATYLIGRIFAQHFAAGGTLLTFNPQDYREFVRTQGARNRSELVPA